MVEVVGVRFREAGHIYYFAPGKSEKKNKKIWLMQKLPKALPMKKFELMT